MELPDWLRSELTKEDLDRLEENVKKAELQTSAEIVPMIVLRSSPAFMSFILALIYSGLLQYVSTAFLPLFFEWGGQSSFSLQISYPIYLAVLWFLFVRFPFLERIATPKAIREYFCFRRAESEFHGLRMWNTKEATGVLFFVSLEEHISVILADEAIDKKMIKGSWDKILQDSIKEIKSKDLPSGIALAVSQISDLIQKDFPIEEGDINELPNHLVIKE